MADVNVPVLDTGERFNFSLQMHMKLDRGGSVYVHRCEDFRITCMQRRETRNDSWVVVFTADDVPDQEFATLRDCVDALRDRLKVTVYG